MGLRLRLASLWLPGPLLVRELERIAERTTAALDSLLEDHAPESLREIRRVEETPATGSLEQRRAAMAVAQNARVEALVGAIGREEAIRLGRSSLHEVGVGLGREVRRRLGVGDDPMDLVRAARLLYRVLGIGFRVEWQGGDKAVLLVDRCALAESYSDEACLVLSAVDEGVVRGLSPRLGMSFEERIAAGAPRCVACINADSFEGAGG
jgi:hypothetical protein